MKQGPNDARSIVWAISEFFHIITTPTGWTGARDVVSRACSMTPTQTGGRSGKETVGAGDEEESVGSRLEPRYVFFLFFFTLLTTFLLQRPYRTRYITQPPQPPTTTNAGPNDEQTVVWATDTPLHATPDLQRQAPIMPVNGHWSSRRITSWTLGLNKNRPWCALERAYCHHHGKFLLLFFVLLAIFLLSYVWPLPQHLRTPAATKKRARERQTPM